MKGFLTLCSAVLALLKVVCIPAEAQDAEMTDTLARAVISSSRPAIASTGLKRFDGGELLGGAAILGSPDVDYRRKSAAIARREAAFIEDQRFDHVSVERGEDSCKM